MPGALQYITSFLLRASGKVDICQRLLLESDLMVSINQDGNQNVSRCCALKVNFWLLKIYNNQPKEIKISKLQITILPICLKICGRTSWWSSSMYTGMDFNGLKFCILLISKIKFKLSTSKRTESIYFPSFV